MVGLAQAPDRHRLESREHLEPEDRECQGVWAWGSRQICTGLDPVGTTKTRSRNPRALGMAPSPEMQALGTYVEPIPSRPRIESAGPKTDDFPKPSVNHRTRGAQTSSGEPVRKDDEPPRGSVRLSRPRWMFARTRTTRAEAEVQTREGNWPKRR